MWTPKIRKRGVTLALIPLRSAARNLTQTLELITTLALRRLPLPSNLMVTSVIKMHHTQLGERLVARYRVADQRRRMEIKLYFETEMNQRAVARKSQMGGIPKPQPRLESRPLRLRLRLYLF